MGRELNIAHAIEEAIDHAKMMNLTPKAIRINARQQSQLNEICGNLISNRYRNTKISQMYTFHGLRILKTREHYSAHIYAVAQDDMHYKVLLHSHDAVPAGDDTINIID